MLFSDFKRKEVINLHDCNKLGYVVDMEIDKCSGCIIKLVVDSGKLALPFFHCDQEYIICYKDIKQIGPDIIIVDIH